MWRSTTRIALLLQSTCGVGVSKCRCALLQGAHHLDQGRHRRRAFQVADVGLDAAHMQRPAAARVLAVDVVQRAQLDGVAQGGAGAVGLHVIDLGRRDAGAYQRVADHLALRPAIGCCHAIALAVVVDRRAADHRADRSLLGTRVRQAHQCHHAAAFATHVTVGACIEGLAAAIGRERLQLAQSDGHLGRQHQVHATGQSQVAFAVAQALARQVGGGERRRAGRVELDRRAMEAKQVGHPPRRKRPRGAERGLCITQLHIGHQLTQARVVI